MKALLRGKRKRLVLVFVIWFAGVIMGVTRRCMNGDNDFVFSCAIIAPSDKWACTFAMCWINMSLNVNRALNQL